jgi:hypothetical protein
MNVLDFTDADARERALHAPLNVAINAAVEHATFNLELAPRGYLGASAAGAECMRKIQFDWMVAGSAEPRGARIFARGHWGEATMRDELKRARFMFAPSEALEFVALEHLQGHADGIVIHSPALPGAYLATPCLWEAKTVNQKNFRAILREGLAHAFPQYAVQLALYQKFLNQKSPALYSVMDADTCETVHFTVPYEARAERAVERVKKIIDATKAGVLLPRAYTDPTDWRCVRGCSHAKRCWRHP